MRTTGILTTAGACLLAVLIVPTTARAQGFVSGSFGAAFGGSTPGDRPTTYGGAAGVMAGPIGFEADVTFTPDFFTDRRFVDDNSITTVMANVLVGPRRGPIRPYAVAGVGLMRVDVTGPLGVGGFSRNDLGMNAGAGIMAFLTPVFGLRADVRYFRNLNDNEQEFGIDVDQFDYWRSTVGVVIRF